MGLDLNRGLLSRWKLSRGRCLPRLTLGLNMSLLLSVQRPDLGVHHLLLLWGHSNATLAELLLKSSEPLLL